MGIGWVTERGIFDHWIEEIERELDSTQGKGVKTRSSKGEDGFKQWARN